MKRNTLILTFILLIFAPYAASSTEPSGSCTAWTTIGTVFGENGQICMLQVRYCPVDHPQGQQPPPPAQAEYRQYCGGYNIKRIYE